MKKLSWLLCSLLSAGSISAQSVVDGFGTGGWSSWDSRDSAGVHLFGENYTNLNWNNGIGVTAGDDIKIAKQIKFLGEGVVVADAAGGTPDATPVGSLNGRGYVRLDGTNANNGKSDLSYVDVNGIAASSVLRNEGFATSYRYYSDSNPTSRQLGLNIEFVGEDSLGNARTYVFVFVQPDPPSFTPNAWNTVTADGTSLFYLYGGGGTPNGTVSMTLAQWEADSTWGSRVFVAGAEIFRVGFNIGSAQRDALIYLDWVQTSLLNGGNTIDFQAIPEPGVTALLVGVLAFATIITLRRRLAK